MNIISRAGQPKIKITLNEFGQPIGPDSKEFANVIGTLVRKKISVAYNDWREVDIKNKLAVWNEIQVCGLLFVSCFVLCVVLKMTIFHFITVIL